MSSYYKKDSFGRFVFKAFLFALVAQIFFIAIEFVSIKTAKHELTSETEIGTVVYSESENSSKFTLSATLKHRDHSHTVVTDVTYKVIFKDAAGNVLSERELVYDGAIENDKTELELAFDSEETKISGRVASAEIEILNENYVNKVAFKGGSVGIRYLLENWLIIVAFFFSLLIMTLGNALANATEGFFSYIYLAIAYGSSGFILSLILGEIMMALMA